MLSWYCDRSVTPDRSFSCSTLGAGRRRTSLTIAWLNEEQRFDARLQQDRVVKPLYTRMFLLNRSHRTALRKRYLLSATATGKESKLDSPVLSCPRIVLPCVCAAILLLVGKRETSLF